MAGFVGAFSARARQIGRNIERYEMAWRDTHPGQEPGPDLLRAWDRRAWAEARPDKVIPTDGTVLTDRWVDELHRLGFRPPTHRAVLHSARPGALDRDGAAATVLSRLGAKRSGWNAADIRGQVELLIAAEGMVTDPAVRIELVEDLTDRAITACVPLLGQDGTHEHIRALTSCGVLAVEADLNSDPGALRTPPWWGKVCGHLALVLRPINALADDEMACCGRRRFQLGALSLLNSVARRTPTGTVDCCH